MAGKQNHGKSWNADAMIKNAKALQRVVKELKKNKPKPSLSDGWANGIEVQRTNYSSEASFWRFPIYCRSRQSSR